MIKRLIKIVLIILAILLLIAAVLGALYYFTEPKITLKGESSMEVTMKEGYQEPGYEAKFWFKDITSHVKVSSDLNDKKVGEYVVKYSVNFLKKTASTTRTVKVVDKEPPVITLNEGSSIKVPITGKFEDPGFTAQDDSDGDVTGSVEAKGIVDTYHTGTYTITYSVTDSYGNAATEKRSVTVEGEPEEKKNKVIYLTFDDGPSDSVTPQVLDTLKKYNVKATFFIIDYGESAEKIGLLKSAIAQRHTIGIHGYSHDYSEIYKSVPAFMENITTLEEKIRNDLDYEPFIIRFPGGSSNTVSENYCEGVMSDLVTKVQEEGYYFTDWDVDSTDASGNNISTDQIISSVKRACSENQYNIVLMHDSDAKQTTAEALPEIIEWAQEEGYTFAAMEKGGPTVHHTVNN